MRVLVLAIVAAAATATAAVAQVNMLVDLQPPLPQAQGDGAPANHFGATPSRQQLYFRHIATLREKLRKTTATDGGQLSADHTAALQRELDALNRQFGVVRFASLTPPPTR